MLANETVQDKMNDQLSPSKNSKKEIMQGSSGNREQPPPLQEDRMRESEYRQMPYNDHYSSYEYRDRYRSYSGSRRPPSPYMSRHSSSRGRDRSYSPRRRHSSRSSYSREDSRRRRRRSFSRSPIRHRSHSRGSYYRHPYHPSMDRGRYDRDYNRPRKARYIER